MMATNLKNKTLIANWVEDRQCTHLEEGNRNPDGTLCTKIHREGHKGIFSPSLSSPMDCVTTVEDSYQPPSPMQACTIGKRQEMIRQQLYQKVSSELHEEFHPPPPKMEYVSTTKQDFGKDFTPTKPPATRKHDIYTDLPLSYWSDNLTSVTGVTQTPNKNSHSPFTKNTAFSTPIEEYLDQPKPHNIG